MEYVGIGRSSWILLKKKMKHSTHSLTIAYFTVPIASFTSTLDPVAGLMLFISHVYVGSFWHKKKKKKSKFNTISSNRKAVSQFRGKSLEFDRYGGISVLQDRLDLNALILKQRHRNVVRINIRMEQTSLVASLYCLKKKGCKSMCYYVFESVSLSFGAFFFFT